jgi:hypothetical protein
MAGWSWVSNIRLLAVLWAPYQKDAGLPLTSTDIWEIMAVQLTQPCQRQHVA